MEVEDNQKIKIVNNLTVRIINEDHTLMNLLKWTISNNWSGDKIEFCGYNTPHPSDELVLFTVQLEDEAIQKPVALLTKITEGLDAIEMICRNIEDQIDMQIVE